MTMGLALITTERVREMENELESYRIGYERLQAEHEKALDWAREIRDTKDAELEKLHEEIEVLKRQHLEDQWTIKYLRQAVAWYEARKEALKR